MVIEAGVILGCPISSSFLSLLVRTVLTPCVDDAIATLMWRSRHGRAHPGQEVEA